MSVGEDLKYLDDFISESVVGVGWVELPRSPAGLTRPELSDLMAATFPDASDGTIANCTGQVWNFVNTIALGDLLLVPLANSKSYRLARVIGRPESRPTVSRLATVRVVDWLEDALPAIANGPGTGRELRGAPPRPFWAPGSSPVLERSASVPRGDADQQRCRLDLNAQ